jgi:hypothetical protein
VVWACDEAPGSTRTAPGALHATGGTALDDRCDDVDDEPVDALAGVGVSAHGGGGNTASLGATKGTTDADTERTRDEVESPAEDDWDGATEELTLAPPPAAAAA